MTNSIIQGQWEQKQISIDLFLGQCKVWRADEAHKNQHGTKFQAYENAICKVWWMKAQHAQSEPRLTGEGVTNTGAEP